MPIRRLLSFGLTVVVVAATAPAAGQQEDPRAKPVVVGLDHVPVAVRDLDVAAERYRQLGFTLKPGRPHENGIRNPHLKFADGTEIELITADEARDPLTSFRVRDLPALRRVLEGTGREFPPTVQTSTGESLFLSPAIAHGLWLEFREPRP